ncbi:hypothetical protein A3D77_01550 [Candidatus Gottesmanbacteria bacterium RIFCSPHIGHO2_02_FULL_39_11]|uniref:Uncharacterized protein n=1 Tax=Candidatus Gottesmanbacteria bacterium RIFCSPHIGHO2_02_FULL_39_11 TaxID=1798382 RepID=A0A1F5ZTN4_9BACT|nr:MAG: hypothetical protein A3D77_01550 [Candidatus Gottesmanbacteria bacterium RIFCSPHIGHO2_02_FULL_39_11]
MPNITPVCNTAIIGLNCDQASSAAAFGKFFSALVGIILFLGAIWTLFQLLRGGLEWITSGGDKGKVMEARERILQSIIGLIILVASWSIYLVLLKFLGLTSGDGVNLNLPKLF